MAAEHSSQFVWFWTFWYWTRESFRNGLLLQEPLQGIGSHWDEWFHHEASEADRHAIAAIGQEEPSQKEFLRWLIRHWVRDAQASGNRTVIRYVLNQLAPLAPFSDWPVFAQYRGKFSAPGVQAVVLAEGSPGEDSDIRSIEVIALPGVMGAPQPAIVAVDFKADEAELKSPRQAARSVLVGKGLALFLASWVVCGRRPYPSWFGFVLGLGWVAVAALIVHLLIGSDPGERLPLWIGGLVALWSGLVVTAVSVAGWQIASAWRLGRKRARQLDQSQIQLRMSGGLILKGSSAGLAYCLNILLALHRGYSHQTRHSWIWRRVFLKLHADAPASAATGTVTADGRIEAVTLEAKLRACLQRGGLRQVITPRQREADRRVLQRLAGTISPSRPESEASTALTVPAPAPRLGFAADAIRLSLWRCRHVSEALLRTGDLISVRQLMTNFFAIAVSVVMLVAMPDLMAILRPPPAPAAVSPGSPSSYDLWVSLDTASPQYFHVVLESQFWTNRRVNVEKRAEPPASTRAEIRLLRVGMTASRNTQDGTIWIERRRRFLWREFEPGERVGRYTLAYLLRLRRE